MASPHHLFARHSTDGFTAAEIAETHVDPYEETPKYALGVVYFVCAALALAALANALHHLRIKRGGAATATTHSKVLRKTAAGWRYLSVKQQKVAGYRFPVLGVGLLMLAFFTFIMGECLPACGRAWPGSWQRPQRPMRNMLTCNTLPGRVPTHSLDMGNSPLLPLEVERREHAPGHASRLHGSWVVSTRQARPASSD